MSIVYAVVACGEKFVKQYEERCRPGLQKIGVTEDRILLVTDADSLHSGANKAILWAREKPDLEALVLLHPDLEILDPMFEAKVRAAFARGSDVGIVGLIGAAGVWSQRWWEGTGGIVGAVHHKVTDKPPGVYGVKRSGEVDVVDGCLMAFSPEWVRTRLADTVTFGPGSWHGHSDSECLSARAAGKRVLVIDSEARHHTTPGAYAGGKESWDRIDDALQAKHHMGKYGRVAAVISVCGHPELLDLQLQSHRIFTKRIAKEDFIVVDASTHGGVQKRTAGVCRKYGATYLQSTGTPQGVTSNVGIKFATERVGAEWLVLANDDLVVGPGWFETMFEEWDYLSRAMQRPGIIGASSNYVSGKQSRCTALRPNVPVLSTKIVISFFALTRADIMAQVGGYAPVQNGSDVGMAYNLAKAGFNSFVSRAFVQHFGSQSLGPQTPDAYRADIEKGNAYMTATHPDWREVLSE